MKYDPSKLFNRQGYISLKEYIEDIRYMMDNGPWRLPIRIVDYVQFYFLMFIEKFSWFSNKLYILHPSAVSPSYAIITSYLKKKDIFSSYSERDIHFRGFFSYYFEKRFEGTKHTMSGYGIFEDQSVAFSKALGEILERTISGAYDMNIDIKHLSYNEISKKYAVLYPPKYHRFLDVQKKMFKVLNYDQSCAVDWVGGINLTTKEKTYIPKQMTSWFKQDFTVDYVFINSTTNGSAGYFSKEGATLRGLLEVIQRDAFLVHWLTMIPPETIDQNTLPYDIQHKIEEFKKFGISIYIANTTSLSIPSVIIIAINEQSHSPQVFITGGSSLNFFEAIITGLREMIVGVEMFYFNNKDIELFVKKDNPPFVSRFGQIERQIYWRGKEKVEKFKWFLSGEVVTYQDIIKGDILCTDTDKLNKCIEILKEKGEDYYPVVYFPENRIQEELGFYVAQVFIPKAFPLYLSEYFGTFDSDRLQEFAESKNVKDWKLNKLPHMFP